MVAISFFTEKLLTLGARGVLNKSGPSIFFFLIAIKSKE
jgi:hypothetical protein